MPGKRQDCRRCGGLRVGGRVESRCARRITQAKHKRGWWMRREATRQAEMDSDGPRVLPCRCGVVVMVVRAGSVEVNDGAGESRT